MLSIVELNLKFLLHQKLYHKCQEPCDSMAFLVGFETCLVVSQKKKGTTKYLNKNSEF